MNRWETRLVSHDLREDESDKLPDSRNVRLSKHLTLPFEGKGFRDNNGAPGTTGVTRLRGVALALALARHGTATARAVRPAWFIRVAARYCISAPTAMLSDVPRSPTTNDEKSSGVRPPARESSTRVMSSKPLPRRGDL